MRTILLIVYSRSVFLISMTEKSLLMRDIVNGEAKRKSAGYTTSQIFGQPLIQHSKSRSPKTS